MRIGRQHAFSAHLQNVNANTGLFFNFLPAYEKVQGSYHTNMLNVRSFSFAVVHEHEALVLSDHVPDLRTPPVYLLGLLLCLSVILYHLVLRALPQGLRHWTQVRETCLRNLSGGILQTVLRGVWLLFLQYPDSESVTLTYITAHLKWCIFLLLYGAIIFSYSPCIVNCHCQLYNHGVQQKFYSSSRINVHSIFPSIPENRKPIP